MKVLVPHKHNEMMIQDLKIGDCFWHNDRLFMKIEVHGGPYDHDKCFILDFQQGVVFRLNNDILVTLDSNVCITELQSEEKINREINIECRARELYEKVHEVIDSSEYKSVFGLHMVHGGTYTGPTYGEELNRLGEALES